MSVYNIIELIKKNKDCDSFHIFSEKYFRSHISKITKDSELKEYTMEDQNLLIILVKGDIEIIINDNVNIAHTNEMVLIKEHERFRMKTKTDCILNFIWSPGVNA